MPHFHNVRFPARLAFGARGGPRRSVTVTSLSNGQERRNAAHQFSRRVFDAGTSLKSVQDIYDILNFFEARQGPLYSFRFRDSLDYKSSPFTQDPTALDQIIGVGDGTQTTFQLQKTYGDTAGATSRHITKPLADTVRVAINGSATLEFTLDELTGVVEFNSPPPNGSELTAGFEFDVPVRFDTPQLDISLDAFGAGEIPSISLIEVLGHA